MAKPRTSVRRHLWESAENPWEGDAGDHGSLLTLRRGADRAGWQVPGSGSLGPTPCWLWEQLQDLGPWRNTAA